MENKTLQFVFLIHREGVVDIGTLSVFVVCQRGDEVIIAQRKKMSARELSEKLT
jgi:hypothetical protein